MNKLIIPNSNHELLNQCEVHTFTSGCKGGQHANKTETAIRLKHKPTGIVIKCKDERSQYQNKRKCLIRLRNKLKLLNYRKPIRIPTIKTKRSVEKRLENKKKHSIKKQLRKKLNI
tara:strand:+ start:120 stop:467 length:348 start_codon:yes stop_codon:yes gene_type:complete